MMNKKVILAPMLILAIILLISPYIFMAIGDGAGSENYLVCEPLADTFVVVNSAGEMAVIYRFQPHSGPVLVGIDSSGNYIFAEAYTIEGSGILSKVTPAGERTVIYTFIGAVIAATIDSSGNYIVGEDANGPDMLSKITPTGERTVIYTFSAGTDPTDVMIDSSGNYIVAEHGANIISKVTPTGLRTVIYTYSGDISSNGPLTARIDSSGNYIVLEYDADILSKITPAGERAVIYTFTAHSALTQAVPDSSGNYIVCEFNNDVLSKVTPDGVRTVIYKFPTGSGLNGLLISNAPQLLFADVTENGLRATWTQSADPSFAGYQLYQSSTQGELGSLVGTNTDVADTSLAVTGLSPWTTYYFTLRALGTNGAYVDYGQRSSTTAKAFWQQAWFAQVVFVAVIVGIIAVIAIYVVHSRSKKRAMNEGR